MSGSFNPTSNNKINLEIAFDGFLNQRNSFLKFKVKKNGSDGPSNKQLVAPVARDDQLLGDGSGGKPQQGWV